MPKAARMNYRHGRMYETLRLSRGNLVVERVNHGGKRNTWRFQPYWLQVLIDESKRSMMRSFTGRRG